jgi:hypothetical protein
MPTDNLSPSPTFGAPHSSNRMPYRV